MPEKYKQFMKSSFRRLVWIGMLACHVPALLGTSAGYASKFMLAVASLFFVLKIVDVSWLRFRTDVRACILLTLAVALLHVNTLRVAESQPNPAYPPLIAAEIIALSQLARIIRWAKRLLNGLRVVAVRPLTRAVGWSSHVFTLLFRPQCLSIARGAPRAPPLLAVC